MLEKNIALSLRESITLVTMVEREIDRTSRSIALDVLNGNESSSYDKEELKTLLALSHKLNK